MSRLQSLFSLILATLAFGANATVPPDELHSQLRWVTLQQGQKTLDSNSRLLLARSAAQQESLADVGLDYRDVYGVIHAESSWVARPGMGKNGVVSEGLAQFEPATARAVGLRNPADPVQAVYAAARLLKEAAVWSARRIEGLNLDAAQRASRLREGISVYYNLSARGREAWRGLNSQQMPIETRLHMRNVRDGAARAGQLTGNPSAPAAPEAPIVASAGSRTRVTFSGAPGQAPASSWIRTKDSIITPHGSITWTSGKRPDGY